MDECATLEVNLQVREQDRYSLDMRFWHPGAATDTRPLAGQRITVHFGWTDLLVNRLNPIGYGTILGESLLESQAARDAYIQSRQMARAGENSLRFSLALDPAAPELHDICWETLRLLKEDLPLAMQEKVLFSRYLSSTDWQLVSTIPKSSLRALAFIVAPHNISTYEPSSRRLSPIDVPLELEVLRKGLGDISLEVIAEPEQATISNLMSRLRDGYDILYFVCHGELIKGRSILYMADEDGLTLPTEGRLLVSELLDLPQFPRLVMLISCQSAGSYGASGSAGGGILAALGPQLAAGGVPAVLAMQGNITMETASRFIPTFFEELQREGQIDRAVAVARRVVSARPDAWMPTLFLRLRSGRLWMTPEPIKVAADTYREERFLDAALPEQVKVGEETELMTMIRLPDSGGLRQLLEDRAEFSPSAEDVKSEDFLLNFSRDDLGKPTSLEVLIEIDTKDFILSNAWQNIIVLPNEDTKQVMFLLTPKKQGELRLLINVYVHDCLVAAGLMKVTGQTQLDEGIKFVRRLLSLPLGVFGARLDEGATKPKAKYRSAGRTRKLTSIDGIGPKYATSLMEAGINSSEILLVEGANRKGRIQLASQTGISPKIILTWVNQADLYRVSGIGTEYADLLETAGVDTIPELARRNPKNLQVKITSVNEEKRLVRRVPSLSMVENWVSQAKALPRVITY